MRSRQWNLAQPLAADSPDEAPATSGGSRLAFLYSEDGTHAGVQIVLYDIEPALRDLIDDELPTRSSRASNARGRARGHPRTRDARHRAVVPRARHHP